MRFGAISMRECVRAGSALTATEPEAEEGVRAWIDEMVWRDFCHAILDAHPRVREGALSELWRAKRAGTARAVRNRADACAAVLCATIPPHPGLT